MNLFFADLLQMMERRQDAVLAVIAARQGSAPREAGAWMLVSGAGREAGSIGGGAVELDAVNRAKSLLCERRCGRKDYRLHPDPSNGTDAVCGGGVTVYFQFIPWDDEAWKRVSVQALEKIAARQRTWLALDLNGGPPTLSEGGGDGRRDGENHFSMEVFAGERAVIFGGGHCGQALVPVLASVGFCVTVCDDRPDYADPSLFPAAERVVCGGYPELCGRLGLTPEDYVVVMTSGHAHDFEVEERALRAGPAYVGVIGSRSKAAAVNAKLRERGVPERAIESVHTPIGLDIGAVTPAEIAVSIAAEMILVRAERLNRAGTVEKTCPMRE